MTRAALTELANALAASTKEFVARRVSSLEGRIVELEAQKQLTNARVVSLEQDVALLRATLEARTSLGLDAAKTIYRSRQ